MKIHANTAQKVIAQLTADGLLEVRPGIGFRQRVPGGYRPAAPSASRQATPSGFNQSAPVTPRRPSGTGFRRPVASDFDRTATNTPRQRAAGGPATSWDGTGVPR